MRNIAIITAAGSGLRLNLNVPKQFHIINNKPLLVYTLEAFQNNSNIDEIIVCTLENYIDLIKEKCLEYNLTKVKYVIKGGNTNGESIYLGIKYISKLIDNCNIIIHDGDRCLIDDEIIDNNIKCLKENNSAVTVIPIEEAIYKCDSKKSIEYISKENLYRIQTPYSYVLNDLLEMYTIAKNKKLDYLNIAPCILMQLIGKKSYFNLGLKTNFKITTSEDLYLFNLILNNEKE